MTSPQMRPAPPRDPRPVPAVPHVQERRDLERQLRVISQNSGADDPRCDQILDRLNQITKGNR